MINKYIVLEVLGHLLCGRFPTGISLLSLSGSMDLKRLGRKKWAQDD